LTWLKIMHLIEHDLDVSDFDTAVAEKNKPPKGKQ